MYCLMVPGNKVPLVGLHCLEEQNHQVFNMHPTQTVAYYPRSYVLDLIFTVASLNKLA